MSNESNSIERYVQHIEELGTYQSNASLTPMTEVTHLAEIIERRDKPSIVVHVNKTDNHHYNTQQPQPVRIEEPVSIYTVDFQSASMVIFSGILIVCCLLGIALSSRPVVINTGSPNSSGGVNYVR